MGFKDDQRFGKIVQQKVVVPKFYKVVWGNNAIIESDLQNNDLAKLLDFSGIDKIVRVNDVIMGLSQRIQRQKYAKYKSITIRKQRISDYGVSNSEYQKTIDAIQVGGLVASYQSHVYVNGNDVDTSTDIEWGIIVDKVGLYKWMTANPKKLRFNMVSEGNKTQTFYYVLGKDLPNEIIIAKYENGDLNMCEVVQLALF